MNSIPQRRPAAASSPLSEPRSQRPPNTVPRGIHLRATYPSRFFERALQARLFGVVVLNVSHALALLDKVSNPRSLLGPSTLLVLTETENDEILLERTQRDVWRLLERMQPAIFIPDTGMVYREDSLAEQHNGVVAYRNRLEKITRHVRAEGWMIRVLPLLKGLRELHFELLCDTFERFGFDNAAFYGAPYASQHVGNAIGDLVRHLDEAITVLDPAEVFVLGQHGVNNFARLPSRVTAAAGLRQFAHTFRGRAIEPRAVRSWRALREDALLANTNTPTVQTMLDGGVR